MFWGLTFRTMGDLRVPFGDAELVEGEVMKIFNTHILGVATALVILSPALLFFYKKERKNIFDRIIVGLNLVLLTFVVAIVIIYLSPYPGD